MKLRVGMRYDGQSWRSEKFDFSEIPQPLGHESDARRWRRRGQLHEHGTTTTHGILERGIVHGRSTPYFTRAAPSSHGVNPDCCPAKQTYTHTQAHTHTHIYIKTWALCHHPTSDIYCFITNLDQKSPSSVNGYLAQLYKRWITHIQMIADLLHQGPAL